jgi:tetratricopeptide (TPR) repeat protein
VRKWFNEMEPLRALSKLSRRILMRPAETRSSWARLGSTCLLVASGLLTTPACGEEAMSEVSALARAYGVGVHAYFANDFQRAYDDLTQAIEGGSRDPRAWYFRGLAARKLGRLDEAEADFSTAAERETMAAADWPVSRSLERVQGSDRLALERHRIRGRVAGLQAQREAVQQRYSAIESRQSEVLRRRRPERISPDPTAKFDVEEMPAEREETPAEETPAEEVDPPAAIELEAEPEPADDSEEAAFGETELQAEQEEMPAEREEMPAEQTDGQDPPAADAAGVEVFGS